MAAPSRSYEGSSSVANHPLARARLSCVPCRKRKSKCDEQIPCSSCLLRGTAEACHLPDANAPTVPRRSTSGHHHSSPHAHAHPTTSHEGFIPLPPPPHKRRRTSPGMMRTISSEGAVEASDLDGTETLRHLSNLQKNLTSLEATIKRQQRLQQQQQEQAHRSASNFAWSGGSNSSWPSVPIRAHPSPLPSADQTLTDAILAAFPSQVDCEILLEFVLQEPDWIVNCISSQWIIPIWSRLVYGARITKSEAALVAAALAVSSLLLSETPHVYYMTSVNPEHIHPPLADFVQNHLEQQQHISTKQQPNSQEKSSPQMLVDDFIVLGLAIDYLRFSGSRRAAFWPVVKLTLRRRADQVGLMDEDSPVWTTFDHLETEMVRRVVWHVIICERWGSVYADFTSPYPLRDQDIKVNRLSWIDSSLSAPFRASPAGLDFVAEDGRTVLDCKLEFRSPAKPVPRLFRHKLGPEESLGAAEVSEICIGLSALAPDVADYISLIKAWKKSLARQAEEQSTLTTSSPPTPNTPPDHRREALLHQGVALCQDIKAWQASITSRCFEPSTLDVTDFFACRKANQASIIHTGVRQILDAVLSVWVTEEMVADVSSPLLVQLQREAYKNARDVVAAIDLTRTLLNCGRAIYFGSWAAYTFFNAATTLAIPLLGAKRLREEARKAQERLGKIVLTDRYTKLSQRSSAANQQQAAGQPESEAHAMISATPALNLDELRTLAPDILRILDLLPHFTVSPLGQEARQRLAMLVETYKIGQNTSDGTPSHAPRLISSGAIPLHPYHQHQHMSSPLGAATTSSEMSASGAAAAATTPSSPPPPSFGTVPCVVGATADIEYRAAGVPPDMGLSLDTGLPDAAGMNDPFSSMSSMPMPMTAEWRDSRGKSVLDDLVALDDAWWGELLSTTSAPDVAANGGTEQGN